MVLLAEEGRSRADEDDRSFVTGIALQMAQKLPATRLTCGDVHLGTGAHVSCHGKGRKARATPLTSAVVTVLHSWMTERAGVPDDSLFPTRYGASLSRDAVERRLAKYSGSAALTCTTLRTKKITARSGGRRSFSTNLGTHPWSGYGR